MATAANRCNGLHGLNPKTKIRQGVANLLLSPKYQSPAGSRSLLSSSLLTSFLPAPISGPSLPLAPASVAPALKVSPPARCPCPILESFGSASTLPPPVTPANATNKFRASGEEARPQAGGLDEHSWLLLRTNAFSFRGARCVYGGIYGGMSRLLN